MNYAFYKKERLIYMIALASDHAGYELREKIKEYFEGNGIGYIDCGAFSPESVDYPLIAKTACEKITAGECEKGILCCGTGVGISIAANKFKGIRAAVCYSEDVARLVRVHNDANVLCLGGRVTGSETAAKLVDIFLNTTFDGGERHRRRIGQMEGIENCEL